MPYTSSQDWANLITSLAPKYKVDPAAALAVARQEGLGGGVGDNGTSFGPFQLHVGGALPAGRDQAWAESPAGIEYALQAIGSVAGGLTGNAAIDAIVRKFERPANPDAEVMRATGGQGYSGGSSGPEVRPTQPAPSFDPAQFEALKQAVLGAGNIQTPASPLGNFPEIANLNKSTFQIPQSNLAAGGIGKMGEEQIAYQKKLEAAQKQQEQDLQDFSKYKQVQKSDGGYDWFDPSGNQVDIATLAQRTGQRPEDIVKNSQNPIDQQYLQDTQRLKDYGQAVYDMATGDKSAISTVKQYNAQDPELQKLFDQFGKQAPQDFLKHITDLYRTTYKRYYVPQTQDPNAWGAAPGNPMFANPQNFLLGDTGFTAPPSGPVAPAAGAARIGLFPGGAASRTPAPTTSGGPRGY